MNDEERRIISEFVARISGATQAPQGGAWGGGSVPQTQAQPPLPPVDRDADAFIAQLFAQYPEARYRITQTAFVQEAALAEAQNRLRQTQWELENTRRQAQAAPPPAAAPAAAAGGGFLGGLFGSRQAAPPPPPPPPAYQQQPYQQPMPPPPQPVYPPNYNPGMLQPQRSGSGFLGTALTAAAGVAGGVLLGNAMTNMFSHHDTNTAGNAGGGWFGGGGGHNQNATPTNSPWSDPGQGGGWGQDAGGPKAVFGGGADKFASDPGYQGGADKFASQPAPYQDYSQNTAGPSTWGNAQGSYDSGGGPAPYDNSGNAGGGYDSGGGDPGYSNDSGGGYDGGGGGGGGNDDQ